MSTAPVPMIRLSQLMMVGMLCMSLLGAAMIDHANVHRRRRGVPYLVTVGAVLAIHGAGLLFSTFTANCLARRFEMRRSTMMGCGFVALGLGYMLLPFRQILSAFRRFRAGTLEVLLNRLVELRRAISWAQP